MCDYYGALNKAQNAMFFVGNTAYMMAMGKSGKVLPQRPFLIVDEAHQLANNYDEFPQFDRFTKNVGKIIPIAHTARHL